MRVADSAAGNPLFLEQMLALLAETGGSGGVAIPPTIQALLAARLDRLAVPERATLERASVVGKDLPWRSAVSALGNGEDVGSSLRTLLRKELIAPHPSISRATTAFGFAHALVRDAAYDGIPKAVRAQLHERFAGWLGRRRTSSSSRSTTRSSATTSSRRTAPVPSSHRPASPSLDLRDRGRAPCLRGPTRCGPWRCVGRGEPAGRAAACFRPRQASGRVSSSSSASP